MVKRIIILSLIVLSFIGNPFLVRFASADLTPPAFTTCLNPQGTIIASPNSGFHGIVGQDEQSGVDAVYKVSDIAVTQCFCADNGQGIQTNWWKINDIVTNEATLESYKNQGWIYIPNGEAWGLDNSPYLAQNSTYTCKSTTTAVVESSSAQSSTSSNNSSNSNNSNSGSPSIFQLANTGNIVFIYGVLLTGELSLIIGLFLHFYKRS